MTVIGANSVPNERLASPRLLVWLVLGMAFALGGALGVREISSPDIGFHLATGRVIAENRAVPETDPFTFTVSDRPYVDLQWGFQLGVYGLYKVGGTTLIVLAALALTLTFAALLLYRCWRRDHRVPGAAVVLLVLFFLGNSWEPRPHIVSWVLGTIILIALEEYKRGTRRWLWALPPTMLLWVNMHSLFILGVVIIGAYVVEELALFVIKRRRIDVRLAVFAAGSIAVCLCNPYHVEGLLLPITQLGMIGGPTAFKSTEHGIAEFMSPLSLDYYRWDGRFVLFQVALFWHLYVGLVIAGLIGALRRLRIAEAILLAGFAFAFWRANKNFGYFVMVSLPVAATGLNIIWRAIVHAWPCSGHDLHRWRTPWRESPWLAGVLVESVLIGAVLSGWWYDAGWLADRVGLGFNNQTLPVDACDFIRDNEINGRVLNCLADGGYIAWATRQKVYAYSQLEVTGHAFYQEYIGSKQPGNLDSVLRTWEPDIAIVRFRSTPYWLHHMSRSKQWRLVYHDHAVAVYLREGIAPDVPAMPQPRAGEAYPHFDRARLRGVVARATRARPPGFCDWMRGAAAYPSRETALSAFYLQTGRYEASVGVAVAGLDHVDFRVPDLLLNVGYALNARGEYELADACFEGFLRAEGDMVVAAEIQRVRSRRR